MQQKSQLKVGFYKRETLTCERITVILQDRSNRREWNPRVKCDSARNRKPKISSQYNVSGAFAFLPLRNARRGGLNA